MDREDFIMDENDEGLAEIDYVFNDVVSIDEEFERKIHFFDFPKSIQSKIISKAAISLIISVILIMIMVIGRHFSFYVVLIVSAIDIITFLNVKYIYDSIKNDHYRVFNGTILSVESRGMKGTMKYKYVVMYNEEKDKYLTFNYSDERTKLKEGFEAKIYLSADEPVIIKDGMMHVEHYFAVTVGIGSDYENDTESKQITIDDYIN